MPSMASITVKGGDNSTDVVFDAISASGGDASPAVWRRDTGATASIPYGLRRLASLFSKWNGPKTARVLTFKYVHPMVIQDSVTTLWSAPHRLIMDCSIIVPTGMTPSEIVEAAACGANILASSLAKSAISSGYAPS